VAPHRSGCSGASEPTPRHGSTSHADEWTPVTRSTATAKLTDGGLGRPPPRKMVSCDSERLAEAFCIVTREDVGAALKMAAWRDVRHRYKDIAQQAALRPALYTALATGPTGLTGRTRLRPPTPRRTGRRAVGARAAGAGPSVAERGRGGRRAARPCPTPPTKSGR
jgi:hypothetical protein